MFDVKLLNCPFCGGRASLQSGTKFFYSCQACGADGQTASTAESAAVVWNRRVHPEYQGSVTWNTFNVECDSHNKTRALHNQAVEDLVCVRKVLNNVTEERNVARKERDRVYDVCIGLRNEIANLKASREAVRTRCKRCGFPTEPTRDEYGECGICRCPKPSSAIFFQRLVMWEVSDGH